MMTKPARRSALFLFPAMMLLRVAAGEGPLSLGMKEAIALSLQTQVDVKLARARTGEARARALQSAAVLLPQVIGTASQSRIYRENLAAMGFGAFPGIPPLIGPFNVFDARVRLTQELLSVDSLQTAGAARRTAEASSIREELVRDQVAAATALAYIEALRAGEARETALSGVDLARKLESQARDQNEAGSAAGIDVARAQTRTAEETLRLLQAEAAVRDADVRLKRLIGVPLGRALQLTDPLTVSTMETPDLEKSTALALVKRAELRAAEQELRAADKTLSAARWKRAPSLSLAADWGLSGNQPDNQARATGSLGVQLGVPLFTSGGISGRIDEARGRRDEAEASRDDLRVKIEEDVLLALDRLQISADQVKTAEEAVGLAEKELSMARNRYATGAGDNVEVVAAQTSLARIQDAYVAALADRGAARVNLAMALGTMANFRF